jgi:type III secretion system FlhB-like substrate exporter
VLTATLGAVTTRKRKDKPKPSAEQKLAEELVARAREQGVALTGPEGLLKQLTKTVLETALDQEMTEHLGHEKHGPAGNEAGNVRNGTRAKTVLTEASGQVGIEVPRHRAGTFEPQIVKKRQRRLTGVDEMVLSLYAKGLTTRRPLRAAAPAARRLRDHRRCVPIPALPPCRSRSSGAYLVLHLGQARRSVRWPTSPPAIYSNSHASFCHIMKKHARPRIAAAGVVESAQKLIA